MRALMSVLVVLGLSFVFATSQGAQKDEKKEVTLKGKICCAKCELMLEKECMNVIVTKDEKDAKKELTFYFDKDNAKKEHAQICTAPKQGSVVGTVSEEGKKKIVTVKTLKFD